MSYYHLALLSQILPPHLLLFYFGNTCPWHYIQLISASSSLAIQLIHEFLICILGVITTITTPLARCRQELKFYTADLL